MSPWGVQVSIIEPGLFKTAMANEERNLEAVQDLWDRLSPETKVEYGEKSLEKCKKLYLQTVWAVESNFALACFGFK